MNICFFSGDITRGGGTERVSVLIANELVKREEYHIVVLSLCEGREKPQFSLDDRIPRYTLGNHWINPGPGYLKLLPRLKAFLLEQEIDVIIDIDIVLDVLSVWVAGRLPVKVIAWEHFNYQWEMQTLYRRLIMRLFTKRADCIVTLTKRDGEAFRRNLHLDSDLKKKQNQDQKLKMGQAKRQGSRGKVHAIHNPMQERREGLHPDRKKQIVTVGRLIHRKGIDLLCPVAEKVLKENPGWTWIVAGTGEMEGELSEYIDAHDLAGRLVPAGKVEDVDPLLAESMIFVLTARNEGLPMCLLEAKTYDLPCISFDIETGPDEIIRDGVNGYLISPFDLEDMEQKLGKLMQDEGLRKEFADNAGLDRENFAMDTIVAEWVSVLEEL